MGRITGDHSAMERARDALAKARSAQQLRQAQAVLLPLEHGLSLEQTALVIGRSVAWTRRLRKCFLSGDVADGAGHRGRGGVRRRNLSDSEEQALLEPFLARVRDGARLAVSQVRAALEARLGRRIALSSVYNLLHRYGWRKGGAAGDGSVRPDAADSSRRSHTLPS